MSEPEFADISAWFADRGLRVRISDIDWSEPKWGHAALPPGHHVWADLLAEDGRLIQGGYGSGDTPETAMSRARERYQQEQEGTDSPGPTVTDAIETAVARMEAVRGLAQSGLPDVLRGMGHAGNGKIQISIWPDSAEFRAAVATHLPADSYEFNVGPLEAGLA